MNDLTILEAVERYIRGEMNPDERMHFETLRKTNVEIDQMVVEHTLFLQQMNRFGEWQKFRTSLHEIHTDLAEQGKIDSARLTGKAKVVYLWKKYKRVTAIAASIAGITAVTMYALVWSITPKPPSAEQLNYLSRQLDEQKQRTNNIQRDVNSLKETTTRDVPVVNYKTGGTGFMIDGKGLMITNAHVVSSSKNVSVFNSKGERFNAIVVKLDVPRDVAIIKVDDEKFKASPLPYSISKGSSEIAEPVFTMGFPGDNIVYSEGYLSSTAGFQGDTLSCQISLPANPGNSGGPVFNNNGEVIGILMGRDPQSVGAIYAVQSKYVFQAVEELKKNKIYEGVKIPSKTTLSGLNRKQQFKKIQEFVYVVKGY